MFVPLRQLLQKLDLLHDAATLPAPTVSDLVAAGFSDLHMRIEKRGRSFFLLETVFGKGVNKKN